jgi:non-homologous end joining protein Ku
LPIAKKPAPSSGNMINLMDALKASLKTSKKSEPAAKPVKAAKTAAATPNRKAG